MISRITALIVIKMFDNESFLSLEIEAQCKPRSRMPQSDATVGHKHKLPYHINDSRKNKTEVGKGGKGQGAGGRGQRKGKNQKAKVVKTV